MMLIQRKNKKYVNFISIVTVQKETDAFSCMVSTGIGSLRKLSGHLQLTRKNTDNLYDYFSWEFVCNDNFSVNYFFHFRRVSM